MKILITGSNGFVGRNLVWNLKNIRDGKDRTRPNLYISEIYGYDIESANNNQALEKLCASCDFVFNLAGVNRPKDVSEYQKGNFGFAYELLNTLKKCNNKCPVMFSSSIQASLIGGFSNSEYGKSKLAVEELLFNYSKQTGAKVLVYRFPNLFGKWSRPNYNSAIATFCNAIANDLEYKINDRNTELDLVYIDDLIAELLDALEGKEHRCEYILDDEHNSIIPEEVKNGKYCFVPVYYHKSLGEIVDHIETFKKMPTTLFIPEIPKGSFEKKLYSMYLSYLPKEKMIYSFNSNVDNRGSFTELFHTMNCGQISVNVAKPGITRGQHWHNSKWEIFIVVSGHGLIQERKIGINPETKEPYPVIEFEVKGEQPRAVQMLPGYTHNIINLSKTDDLVTVMWANELFEADHPDTFYEAVVLNNK